MRPASCSAFSSTRRLASSTSWYLPSTSCSCRRAAPPVGEVLVGLVQLLLTGLQLLRLGLRLLEQLLGDRVGLDRVQDQADALGELVEQRLVSRAEGGERRQLDNGAHRALEEDRQDDDVERGRLAEPRVDLDVVARGRR